LADWFVGCDINKRSADTHPVLVNLSHHDTNDGPNHGTTNYNAAGDSKRNDNESHLFELVRVTKESWDGCWRVPRAGMVAGGFRELRWFLEGSARGLSTRANGLTKQAHPALKRALEH